MITGNLSFVFYPRVTAGPTAFVPYGFQFTLAQLPRVYTPDGTASLPIDGPTTSPPTPKLISIVWNKELQMLPKEKQLRST